MTPHETPYSNRELDQHFRDIKETLGRIEQQTTRTNGRVSALENWKWKVTGVFIAASIVISLVVYIYQSQVGELRASVDKLQTK